MKDAHYKGAKKLGHGKGYKYPHNSPTGYVLQDYLGRNLAKKYYNPKNRGHEKIINLYLQKLKNQVKELNDNNE